MFQNPVFHWELPIVWYLTTITTIASKRRLERRTNMNKMVKKIVSFLLALGLVLPLAACGNSQESAAPPDSSDGDKVTITLWSQFSDPNSTDGNYVAFYNALESIKTDMPNVEVIHEGTESESYKVKLKTSMAARELPDVFFNWGAGTMKPYVDAGLVLPLDDYMTDDIKSRILGGTLDNFTFDGEVYGYPYSVAVLKAIAKP